MQPENPPFSPPPAVNAPPTPNPDYSFLNESPKSPKKLSTLLVGKSMPIKLLAIAALVLIVIIMFVVIKGLVVKPIFSKTASLNVVIVQQEMIRLLSTDVTPANLAQLSPTNQNFDATAAASIASAQTQLLAYLKGQGYTISAKLYQAEDVASLDNQLSQSLSTNTFDTTFSGIMQSQLKVYQQRLTTAYNSATGSNGKKILKQDYTGSVLLLKALNLPTS